MKLTTSNTYDVSQIADSKSYQELETFFDYINTFSSDVVQAFNKRISFTDNLTYESFTLSVAHGQGINIGAYKPLSVFIQSETPWISYKLTTNADSTKVLTVFFKETHNIFAKTAIWQAGTIVRYVVQDVLSYSVGDVVKFSGFLTRENNGNYLITEIDTDNNYLYVNNRNRTSATGDESKTGFGGTSLVKHSIVVGIINA